MEVEWLIIADAAQVAGGKLFLLGGGWDVLTVNSGFPLQQRCAVAASFRVPWNDTNVRHGIKITIADEDHDKILLEVGGELEVGRPAGIPPGHEQRAQIAADLQIPIERPGTYVVIARIGEHERRASFVVVPGPGLALQAQQQGGTA